MPADAIVPDWPAPDRVRARLTLRTGVPDVEPRFGGVNLADHVGDDPERVRANRRRLEAEQGVAVGWLAQVHGTDVIELGGDAGDTAVPRVADAAWTQAQGVACAVLTADGLPVIACDRAGTVVGIAHCGWRGLAEGVLASLVRALPVPASTLMAWIGPGIGQVRYEVGEEVRDAVVQRAGGVARAAFVPGKRAGKYLADLEAVARVELRALGVLDIHGGGYCTVRDPRFYSFRRDGVTGRMATLIWLA